jgi:hypothetical protein
VTSAISFTTAAYLTTSSSFRGLLLCAAAMSFSIIPFTGIYMISLNNDLEGMHKAGLLQDSSKTPSVEEERALETIDRWRKLHRIRLALGAAAWIAGLAALVVCM